MKNKLRHKILQILIVLFLIILFFPIMYTLFYSFLPADALSAFLEAIKYRQFTYIPIIDINDAWYFTLDSYIDFFNNAAFKKSYINAVFYSTIITLTQLVISLPIAFVLAKLRLWGKNGLLFLFILLIIIPFQITMVSNYILFEKIGILDNAFSILLPGMFSPFGIFWFSQSIKSVQNDIIEYSFLDTSNIFIILYKVIVPSIHSQIRSYIVLVFTFEWAKVEIYLIYFKNLDKMPLSVILRNNMSSSPEIIFAPSIIYMLLPMFLFFVFFSKNSFAFKEI